MHRRGPRAVPLATARCLPADAGERSSFSRGSAAACRARCCAPCMSASSACSPPACWRSTGAKTALGKVALVGASASLAFLVGLYQWDFYRDARHPRRHLTGPDLVDRHRAIVDALRARLARARAGPADRRGRFPRLHACSAISCPRRSIIAATISSRWWSTWRSAPKASTARRPPSRPPTSSSSSCSARSWSRPAIIRFLQRVVDRHLRRRRAAARARSASPPRR